MSRNDTNLQFVLERVTCVGLLVCAVTLILWTASSMLVLLMCMLETIYKHREKHL